MEPVSQLPESGQDGEEDAEDKAPLSHAMEATSLSVTLLNATLSYRLTLSNRSDRMIRNIAISGDMVSAHSAMPVEQQLAGPAENLAPLHRIQALLPGQSAFLNGQMRLPIGAIHPLRREQAVLFVPLARMRIEASGMETVLLRTSVVGQKPAGPGAGLRPFRLDLGPRIYSDLGQRALSLPA